MLTNAGLLSLSVNTVHTECGPLGEFGNLHHFSLAPFTLILRRSLMQFVHQKHSEAFFDGRLAVTIEQILRVALLWTE